MGKRTDGPRPTAPEPVDPMIPRRSGGEISPPETAEDGPNGREPELPGDPPATEDGRGRECDDGRTTRFVYATTLR